jgi:hypothetical protein
VPSPIPIIVLQVATFVGLGIYFIAQGTPKLGAAQLLLGAITVLIYA